MLYTHPSITYRPKAKLIHLNLYSKIVLIRFTSNLGKHAHKAKLHVLAGAAVTTLNDGI